MLSEQKKGCINCNLEVLLNMRILHLKYIFIAVKIKISIWVGSVARF